MSPKKVKNILPVHELYFSKGKTLKTELNITDKTKLACETITTVI